MRPIIRLISRQRCERFGLTLSLGHVRIFGTIWREPRTRSRSDHRPRGQNLPLIQCNINYTELRTTFEPDRKTPNKPYFIDFAVCLNFSRTVREPKNRILCILFTLGLYEYAKNHRVFVILCTRYHLVGFEVNSSFFTPFVYLSHSLW